jgi:hypothetical protein
MFSDEFLENEILLFRPDKIIIHTSNSIATSVKLYERHKLIAEELFKLKQARIHNQSVIVNLYQFFLNINTFRLLSIDHCIKL